MKRQKMTQQQVQFGELYRQIEPVLMPIIRRTARQFSASLGPDQDFDDAVQESRIALAHAMMSYDYNKSRGGIYNFAKVVVRNALCGMAWRAATRKNLERSQMEPDDETPSLAPGPDEDTESMEMVERLRVLKMRLLNSLNEREAEIFSCLCHPSDEFSTFLRNIGDTETSNQAIAKFLGLSKNAIDWSLHKIRNRFVGLVETEFSDMLDEARKQGRWPTIEISAAPNDSGLVRRCLEEYRLDPRPLSARTTEHGGSSQRIVEHYAWGAVLFLRQATHEATVIMIGRVNLNSGLVMTDGGWNKSLADRLPWYTALVRELKGA